MKKKAENPDPENVNDQLSRLERKLKFDEKFEVNQVNFFPIDFSDFFCPK